METPENEPIAEKLARLKPHIKFTYNDKGNGALFAAVFRDKCRYNVTAKEWFVYKDGYWQQDTGGMIVSGYAKDLHTELARYSTMITDDALRKGFDANVEKLGRLNFRDTMIKDARDVNYIRSEDFDKNDWLFNCRNGTYDLKNGYFRKHNPNDLISKMSNVTYNADAESPLFEKFIKDIMCSDMGKAKYLQTALGYALTGDTSQECFFILYGATTRNGKGTLMETISHMMGDGYAMSSQPEVFARKQNKDSRQASGDIARLKGVRFLNASEPPKSMVFDAALLKTLTGRDTITARHLHEREFQFVPNFKLFINTNYLPYVNDDTLFSSERVNVITFEKHFGSDEQDRSLKQKLKQEENISGIFNWCLDGLQNYLSEGLKRPMSVSAANEEYRRSGDRMTMFINECLEAVPGGGCQAKDVYALYRDWCSSNGFNPENMMNWTANLRQKNLLRDRDKINGVWRRSVIFGYVIAENYVQISNNNDIYEEPPL
ncbi:MAG: phage/plasmid primase, P4 family [Huintestinicola sp.]